MADEKQPNLDPSAQFQDYVNQWERSVDQFFNQMMGTEQFSQSMNQMQQLQLQMQQQFKDVMANQLINFNMPSRDDILEIQENLRAIDNRMARIEERLSAAVGRNEPGNMPRKSPPRTRKPPSKEGS